MSNFLLTNVPDRERLIGLAELRGRVWSVSGLLRAISDSLEGRFNPVAVTGEITGFSRAASGHCYFSLKDEQGQVRCAMFRRAAALLDFSPADGQRVELRGRLGVYDQRGELQLVVESLQRAGEGDLFKLFLALKAKLEAEGLFDPSRKRPIPVMPKAVGVVTSLGAAALHDVVHALERRIPQVPVVIYPASVQGAQAASDLRQALISAYRRNEVDVLLLVRGGGSIEDLWPFNDEQLARTVSEAPMPIISGVGHETDFTIADFCADLRAPTPTAAAELCSQPREVLMHLLEAMFDRLERGTARQIDLQAQRLDRAASQVSRPSHLLMRQQTRLASLWQTMRQASQSRLRNHSGRLDRLSDALPRQFLICWERTQDTLDRARVRLDLLDPKLVLERGYAWLSDMQGKPVTSTTAIHTGQPLRATLADGEVDLTVSAPRLI
jgi:exodeoxyribonuclease VII large subunit